MFFKIYIFLVVFSIGFLKTDEVSVFPVRNKSFDKRRWRLHFYICVCRKIFLTFKGRISSYISLRLFRHTTASGCALTADALWCYPLRVLLRPCTQINNSTLHSAELKKNKIYIKSISKDKLVTIFVHQ